MDIFWNRVALQCAEWIASKYRFFRYLNYYSKLPFSYKRNTITILTDKILKLADEEFHSQNFKLLKDTLKQNGYPEKLIDKYIEHGKNKKSHKKIDEKTEKFVAIPYVQGAFEKIKETFKPHNIKVVGKGDQNLKKVLFSKIKDKIPKTQQSGLVYKIRCTWGMVYIGQTIQYLEKRISDHKYHIRIKNKNHSALCDHVISTEHEVNWDEVEILHRENKEAKRDVLEMIYIKTTTNTMNKQVESQYLSNIYNHVLEVPKASKPIDNEW